jgi:hypothetical protein
MELFILVELKHVNLFQMFDQISVDALPLQQGSFMHPNCIAKYLDGGEFKRLESIHQGNLLRTWLGKLVSSKVVTAQIPYDDFSTRPQLMNPLRKTCGQNLTQNLPIAIRN